ncbi:unnamed protein product [Brassica oleracea]
MLFCFYSLIFKQVHEYFLLDVGKLADQIRYNYRISSLNKYPVGAIGLNQTKIEGCKRIVKTLCLSIWVQFPRILHPMKWLVLAKNGAPKLNEQSICALNPGSKKLICRKGIDYDYFEFCFEGRKRLYDHQHDARRSDHIFNLAQLKDASEEDKTDSGLSQMAKILVHEVQHSVLMSKLLYQSNMVYRLTFKTCLLDYGGLELRLKPLQTTRSIENPDEIYLPILPFMSVTFRSDPLDDLTHLAPPVEFRDPIRRMTFVKYNRKRKQSGNEKRRLIEDDEGVSGAYEACKALLFDEGTSADTVASITAEAVEGSGEKVLEGEAVQFQRVPKGIVVEDKVLEDLVPSQALDDVDLMVEGVILSDS